MAATTAQQIALIHKEILQSVLNIHNSEGFQKTYFNFADREKKKIMTLFKILNLIKKMFL